MENKTPYSISIKELAALGEAHLPDAFVPSCHLIYSSPATLSYNSPGAYGFGVKRAALVLPESVMLLVAPGCCGRNSSILGVREDYADRMFYLKMDETDLISGRHLKVIPRAIKSIVATTAPKPKAVIICITCVDALLGTDLERVCRKAEEETGVIVVPSYMYALTREGRKPPMTAIRSTLYSLLKRGPVDPRAVNLLGFFTPLDTESELFSILRQAGIRTIRQISACRTLEEYYRMGEANFNIVLDPESRFAAEELKERLGIPYIELTRLYDISRIQKQYALFASAIGAKIDDTSFLKPAKEAADSFTGKFAGRTAAVGQMLDAHPFEFAYSLVKLGLKVTCVIAIPSETDFPYIRALAKISPDTKVYTGISPTMMNYDKDEKADITFGADIGGYFPDAVHVDFNSEIQPFGYQGVVKMMSEAAEAMGVSSRPVLKESEYAHENEDTRGLSSCVNSEVLAAKEGETITEHQNSASDTSGVNNLRHLAPFSPDQSGASSVLYEFGGLIVILDAGGCAGNVCGFDEPRWFGGKSAIFSAGLRDMDAILGRDNYLIAKIEDALRSVDASFIGIIGTPVPSVIGTDYLALRRMAEKKFGLPVIAIDTNGMENYEAGEKKAYLALLDLQKEAAFSFSGKLPKNVSPDKTYDMKTSTETYSCAEKIFKNAAPEKDYDTVVFGATPLNFPASDSVRSLIERLAKRGETAACIGYGADFDSLRKVRHAKRSLVIAPSGLAPARRLSEENGIPYSCGFAFDTESNAPYRPYDGKILVVHQQILANEIRLYLQSKNCTGQIDVASFFTMDDELMHKSDVRLENEDTLFSRVFEGGYDAVMADPLILKTLRGFEGTCVSFPHAAVSGNLYTEEKEEELLKRLRVSLNVKKPEHKKINSVRVIDVNRMKT